MLQVKVLMKLCMTTEAVHIVVDAVFMKNAANVVVIVKLIVCRIAIATVSVIFLSAYVMGI